MRLKSIALGLALLSFSSISSAVDGYKGVKFGSDFNQLKAAKLCTWKKYPEDSLKGFTTYFCEDFKFSGLKTIAMAFFIEGSFERLSIVIEQGQMVTSLAETLKKKYGNPSSSFTTQEFDNVQANGGDLAIKFDNDTIMIGLRRDPSTKVDSAQLLYSSTEYFPKYNKLQQQSLANDL